MKNRVWSMPVMIGDEIIFNSFQGHRYLLRLKTNSNGAKFADAERALLSEMDGRLSAEEAREKFAAALRRH